MSKTPGLSMHWEGSVVTMRLGQVSSKTDVSNYSYAELWAFVYDAWTMACMDALGK